MGWYEYFLLQMRRTYCLGVADSRFPDHPGQEEKIPLALKRKQAYLTEKSFFRKNRTNKNLNFFEKKIKKRKKIFLYQIIVLILNF